MSAAEPTFIDCEHGSDVWAAERCGLVTASRCPDVTAKIKKGESAARRNYRAELISEILTDNPCSHYVSREMQWGLDQEKYARAAYEMQRDVLVDLCGFVIHPSIERFGASPDGLVGDDGMIQIKCPNTSTHLAWMLAGCVPEEHLPQMLAELACSGRKWSDFVSFDPRLPEHLQLFVCRLEFDNKLVAALEAQVVQFNAEIDATIAQLPQPEGAQPIVQALDDMREDEPDYSAEPRLSDPIVEPPIAKAKVITMPIARRPTYDDVDPKTGKRKWVNYAAYEVAKDEWLQRDTLRMFQETLNLVVDRRKLQ